MKKFLFSVFFGGDDVVAAVFQMLAVRLEAIKHRALRVQAEEQVKLHFGNEKEAVDQFVGLRESVLAKLMNVGVE